MTLTNCYRFGAVVVFALLLLTPRATPDALAHQVQTFTPRNAVELGESDAAVDRMVADRDLRRSRLADDTLLVARTHERLDKYYRGIRVFGGNVVRQMRTVRQSHCPPNSFEHRPDLRRPLQRTRAD
jgi:hypothetical protein